MFSATSSPAPNAATPSAAANSGTPHDPNGTVNAFATSSYECNACHNAERDLQQIHPPRADALTIPVSQERAHGDEPVAQADLLPFFAASRRVVDRHFDDPRAALRHFCGDFVIELEPARVQWHLCKLFAVEELQCRDRVGQITSRKNQCSKTERSSADVRGKRLVRMPPAAEIAAA